MTLPPRAAFCTIPTDGWRCFYIGERRLAANFQEPPSVLFSASLKKSVPSNRGQGETVFCGEMRRDLGGRRRRLETTQSLYPLLRGTVFVQHLLSMRLLLHHVGVEFLQSFLLHFR